MINLANQREALIAEVEVFKKDSMELWFVPDLAASYTNRDFFSYSIIEDNQVFFMIEQTRQLWEFWNKAKDHNLPKGSVLIVEDQIKTMWQDNEEPENCVNKEKDFNCLGDCLDIEDIISITKQRYAYISAEKVYGTWVAKFEAGELKKDYFFVGSQKECEEIVESNKALYSSRMGANS
ncbi:TPA: hypothetical protein ACSE38_002972 [Acinetobacter baumannii]|jgi:hypothetical protein|uniref:Uncharacterized protein n=18 Tax=Gammaproteobacteria TaxID=1236 RepID=A0A0D7TTJ7_ACIBA|nr:MULTISPECIES: hypothetical protein [Acinetobacter]ADX91334.1 hypothetical protein ABTW07_0898 [Acinetobacter baumannii TCDC-AB0715]AHX28411.1 hypothetical protein A478_07440 [Acinetobacter baumannii AC12]AHX66040.1 hypothetical protein B856_12310 [Acinetobacter baumannii AC30]KCY49364.1 hypothetical protein J715_1863 [Acinetobacter baumannii 1571545]DAL29756.1 MAG TPA_asm: hypothetical protein [Caudoviricetes sp.]HBX4478603.1 hypothetical protein [Klebsiella pneumoniae]